MAEEIKIGAAIIEIKTTLDQLKAGLNKAKSETKQSVSEMQKNLSNIKMQMDDRLLKLKLNDVQKLHAKLKKRLEEKIKLNYDLRSIETTRRQLESVKNALRDIKTESQSVSKFNIGGGNIFGNAKGIAAGFGLAIGVSEVAQITAEAVKLAARVEGVQNAFDKLNNPKLLEELNKATNQTISNFELMRSILTGLDLGASEEQLKTFAEFARLESVRKGTDTLQVFNNILGGVLRGSTELLDNFGISLTELNQEIEILAEEKLNKAATGLSAVERRILSVDAATAIMNRRLAETGEIAKTSGEKLAQMTKRLDDAQADLGKALINISNESADVIDSYLSTIGGLYKVLIDLVVEIDVDESAVENEADKAKQKTKKIIGRKWQILPDGTKIQVLPGGEELFDALNSTFKQIEDRIKELKEKRLTLTPKDFIDIKNIDSEIAQLQKFLKPQEKIIKEKLDLSIPEIKLFNYDKEFQTLEDVEAEMFRLQDAFDEDFTNREIARTEKEIENDKRVAEEKLRRENEIHQLQMNAISEFGYALEGLGSHGETMVSYFNAALQAALRIAEAVNTMETDSFSGILGIASGGLGFVSKLLGLNKGGSIINSGGGNISYQPYKKFATGVSNFVVPPGFNRDNYIVGVQSGERLDVTPANAVGKSNSNMSDAMLKVIADRIGAMNGNLIESMDELIAVNINKALEAKLEGGDIKISYDRTTKEQSRYY